MKAVPQPVRVSDEAENGDQRESERRAVSSDESLHEKKTTGKLSILPRWYSAVNRWNGGNVCGRDDNYTPRVDPVGRRREISLRKAPIIPAAFSTPARSTSRCVTRRTLSRSTGTPKTPRSASAARNPGVGRAVAWAATKIKVVCK